MRSHYMQLVHLMSLLATINQMSTIISQAAPIETLEISRVAPIEASASHQDMVKPTIDSNPISGHHVEATPVASIEQAAAAPAGEASSAVAAPAPAKLKRDSRAKVTSLELDTQETGYLPTGYQSADSDYGYDAGKNSYGKQASDWSLYDQGNHGLYDKYGDKAWKDQGHNAHSSHGKHDSYGNSYNSHGSGHGSGYYSRDRGYGYEKHYAYDKEVASKNHADSHSNYGSNQGLHDYYGNSGSQAHSNAGHDKYGQLSRYGNHGYGKRGSNLAAHHDYGHNANKGHYYTQSSHPSSYPSYSSSHVPTYRSTYSDYGPQIGYPSSYPSYY